MASTEEFDSIKKAVSGLLDKCKPGSIVSDKDLEELEKLTYTNLANDAFTGSNNYVHAANIALKEMHDYANCIARFCKVYKDDRAAYYKNAENDLKLHASIIDHQAKLYASLHKVAES